MESRSQSPSKGKAVVAPPKKDKKPAKAQKTELPKKEKKGPKGKAVSKSKSKSPSPARGRAASKSKSPASKSRSPMKKGDKKGAAKPKPKASPAKKQKKQPQEESKAVSPARSKSKSPNKKSAPAQGAAAKGGKKQASKAEKEKKPDAPVDEFIKDYVHLPKSATSAYAHWMTEFLAENAGARFATAGPAWGALSAEEKAPWEAKATADKSRRAKQLKEMEEHGYFTTEDGVKSTDLPDPRPRAKRYPPGTVVPSKAASNYFCWLADGNRARIRGEGPNALSPAETLREAGVQWAALTDEEKEEATGELRAQAVDKEEGQWAELEEKGYFTMADGTKSSDHQKKIKKAKAAAAAKDDVLDLEAGSEDDPPRKVTRKKPKKAKD